MKMTHDEIVAAYNAAIEAGDVELASRLGDRLLDDIFNRIMAEDEYQARQR